MTPEQCRAARALLGWSQKTLAARAGVSSTTIRSFEQGMREMMPANAQAIVHAFTDAGIEIIPGGVRRAP